MQRPSRCRTPRSAVKRRRLRTRAERRTRGREDGTGPRNGRIPPKFSGSGEEGSVRSSTTEISRCLRVTPLLVPRSIAVGLPFFLLILRSQKSDPTIHDPTLATRKHCEVVVFRQEEHTEQFEKVQFEMCMKYNETVYQRIEFDRHCITAM